MRQLEGRRWSKPDRDNAGPTRKMRHALRDRLDGSRETARRPRAFRRRFVRLPRRLSILREPLGVTATGSITLSLEVMPGAARIDEIRTQVRDWT